MALPPGLPPPGMGAGPGAAPAMPPQLGAARPNMGGATQQQGNPGNASAAISQVRNALRMLEQALPNIPMGSPMHADILKAVQNLGKHLQPGEGSQSLDLQSILQMGRGMAQQAPMQALSRMFPQQANQPPAMPGGPPGGGGGGGPPMMPTGAPPPGAG